MTRPRGRTGLQTWLIGSFITLGVAASLLMFLVLLPTLEGSVVSGATERTSQATVEVLEDLSEVPGSGFGQADGTFHFRTTFLPQQPDLEVVLPLLTTFQNAFMNQYAGGKDEV